MHAWSATYLTNTMEPPNKGQVGDNQLNSAVVSFV